MRDGLYEVRTNLENGRISRVLFCFHDGMMVLLNGFIKKSKKTPIQDLELARVRKREVENG
jgi:phage-related protein